MQRKVLQGGGGGQKSERTAMANGNRTKNERNADIMMLDSVKMFHLTPVAYHVQLTTTSEISFTHADNSPIRATHQGVRKLRMRGEGGVRSVSLSNTLLASNASVSHMSVPALV